MNRPQPGKARADPGVPTNATAGRRRRRQIRQAAEPAKPFEHNQANSQCHERLSLDAPAASGVHHPQPAGQEEKEAAARGEAVCLQVDGSSAAGSSWLRHPGARAAGAHKRPGRTVSAGAPGTGNGHARRPAGGACLHSPATDSRHIDGDQSVGRKAALSPLRAGRVHAERNLRPTPRRALPPSPARVLPLGP